jgi:hypothetical protein
MDDQVRWVLREIGAQLDQNRFPTVHNGGVVVPSSPPVVAPPLGTEMANATCRPNGPATGPRQGSASWQRTTGRPRPARRTTSATRRRYRAAYETQLTDVGAAYPETEVWFEDAGMWLLTNSAVLNGLGKKATFLVAIPFDPQLRVTSWGFWTAAIGVRWIGPRHTNWPDGDICAFTPSDGTWRPGGSLVKLLDLNTLWALRQLHLEELGRWPGYHSAPHPHERLTELQDDEFCGCEKSHRLYHDCCKTADLAADRAQIAIDFCRRYLRNGPRCPPHAIVSFAMQRRDPPKLRSLGLA